MNTRQPGASAAWIFASPIGPRVMFDKPDDRGVDSAQLLAKFAEMHTELKGVTGGLMQRLDKVGGDIVEINARALEIEQKMARRPGSGGPLERKTPGQMLIDSDEFKALAGLADPRGRRVAVEFKAITTLTEGTGSAGGMLVPDYRPDPVPLPRLRLTVRNLIAPGQTIANTVFFVRQTGRQLMGAPVVEASTKPQSDLTFGQIQAPVTTIAHFMLASRQILDDAPALRSIVDSELLYGLGFVEEAQILSGDGTGVNLFGLIPQATAYSGAFSVTGETAIDRLGLAILQTELANLPATGMVLSNTDWRKIMMTKDSLGRYIVGDPINETTPRLWGLPVVPTNAMATGNFLVGSFYYAAQIFDRLDKVVLVSTEDSDNFRKNLVTLLAEERLALAVKQPLALTYGAFP